MDATAEGFERDASVSRVFRRLKRKKKGNRRDETPISTGKPKTQKEPKKPKKPTVSQQESSRAQCLNTALDKKERVRILTRKMMIISETAARRGSVRVRSDGSVSIAPFPGGRRKKTRVARTGRAFRSFFVGRAASHLRDARERVHSSRRRLARQ